MTTHLSVIISSCDKFSDLWDANIAQYRKFWQGEACDTFLVTDKPTSRHFDGVEIVVADENMSFPSRIQYALQFVKTDYVLVTLDDYFLIQPVIAENLRALVDTAKEEDIDYLLLYNRRKTNPKKYDSIDVLHDIDLTRKYAVTLYPAIWKAAFLCKTVKEGTSPWAYEASLAKTAIEENAVCKFSHTGSFDILDVVRKGKVLHRAKRYFKKHQIDIGARETISYFTEFKLGVMDRISWYTPKFFFRIVKKVARKCGIKFYSED